MRSNRSAVAVFSVSAVTSVSPVNQHEVQLLLFPWCSVSLVFFFECCIECHTVLNHQPMLHPDPSFVKLSRCVFSDVVTLRVYPRSKVSVEVARDDPSVFFVVAVGLND